YAPRPGEDRGRGVSAIPGAIHSPMSKGCHSLIKSGAKLVESAEDVLSELAALHQQGAASPRQPSVSPALAATEVAAKLLEQMGFDPIDIDSLCARVGLSAQQISAE